jgi:hypothetical protein
MHNTIRSIKFKTDPKGINDTQHIPEEIVSPGKC